MKKIIVAMFVLLSPLLNASQVEDTVKVSDKVYVVDSILVEESREDFGIAEFPTSKDNFSKILNLNGFTLIRKGTFIAQDIFSEGFKRADVTVVIDGEQYHSACPNRMDSPLTRVNPLEMNLISFSKERSSFSTGLGGGLLISRIKPSDFSNIKTAFTQSAQAESGSDFAFSAVSPKVILSGRYATGYGYEDGDKNNFETLYGFSDDHKYQLGEISAVHKVGAVSYRGAFTYSDNIMFPYLKMDERLNRIYSGNVTYKNQKIYFNYTDHMMDNQLRVSSMFMRTSVQNLTLGFVNDNVELLYRNWDSDNEIVTLMETIENHLIPDLSYFSGTYQNSYSKNKFRLSYKAGLKYLKMNDTDRLEMFTPLYPDAEESNYYYSLGATFDYVQSMAHNSSIQFTSEIATSEPTLEQVYVAVQKPGMTPYWVGNPELSQPLKLSLRSMYANSKINISVYTHYISNYINLTNAISGTRNYLTYENIDAHMIGLNANYKSKYLSLFSGYTYAKNKTNDIPLSEIPPFFLITTLKSPRYKNSSLILTHTYNDAQTRVDSLLTESETTSWDRFDISLTYFSKSYQVSFGVENILDKTYQQHLSYLRDPFSSGIGVNEPGRTIRLSLLYDYNL